MRLKTNLIAGSVAISLPLLIGVYRVWSQPKSTEWQSLSVAASSELTRQIGEEHLTPGFDDDQLGQMKILQPWQFGQAKALYLIDSRVSDLSTRRNPLCGALGCAFFGYIPTDDGFQNVLNIYLNPHLPPDVLLIETNGQLHDGMPELVIHQIEGEQLIQMTLVLNNQRYEIVETQYLPTE